MENKEMNAILLEKLTELNELEIKKSKVLAAIFQKTTYKIMDKKIQGLKIDFEEQAEFYGQKIEKYEKVYEEIVAKYKEQLLQIIDSYHELFINLYLELQETECNQKIAITNLKKSYEGKKGAKGNKIEEYNKKIKACLQKKMNYDVIIEECENELALCASNVEKKINALFQDKSGHISLKQESVFEKVINKMKNIFSGKMKFNSYVIEPIQVELEMMENKLPDIVNAIKQEMIVFVAKIKQAKAETNEIFENMI